MIDRALLLWKDPRALNTEEPIGDGRGDDKSFNSNMPKGDEAKKGYATHKQKKWTPRCPTCNGTGRMWSVEWKKYIHCHLCRLEDQQ